MDRSNFKWAIGAAEVAALAGWATSTIALVACERCTTR